MTFTPIFFDVPGEPRGQPRARAFANRKGQVRMYTPGSAEHWKGQIALAAKPHIPETPIDFPVDLGIHLFFKRPARLNRRKDPEESIPQASRPDADNVAKAVMDALVTVGMLKDDCFVSTLNVVKRYATKKDGAPFSMISILGAG